MIHQRKILKAIAYAILLCFTSLTGAQPLYAVPANDHLPIGPNNDHKPELIAGAPVEVSSSTYPTSQMEIVQQGATSVLQWKDFSIGADATVNFSREGGGSFNSFNYVNGGNVSEIYGQLNAIGGNIFIANPSGVQIGNSAQINVGSLYVTNKSFSDPELRSMTDRAAIDNALAGKSAGAAELMSLGSITSATNVTFDGGRIVLDTDRLFTSENGIAGEKQLESMADINNNLTIRTNDEKNVVLGYEAYESDSPNKVGEFKENTERFINIFVDGEKLENGIRRYMWVEDLFQLQAMGDYTNGWFALRNAIDANYSAEMNEGDTFDPIANFIGRFDGLDYHIFGLTINKETESNVGLFGSVSGEAIIRNVTLNGGSITGNENVGSIAGSVSENATIENITNTADVKGNKNVGGIIGSLTGTAGGAAPDVHNFVNAGTVSGVTNVGGIVGEASGVTLDGRIYNLGAVIGDDTNKTWSSNVGGIAGYATNTTIGNALDDENAEDFQIYNQLGVTGGYNVGGIVGSIEGDSTITNVANHGDVTATGFTKETYNYHSASDGNTWENENVNNVHVANVGGIAGSAGSIGGNGDIWTSPTYRVQITDVQNDGDVKTASTQESYTYTDENGETQTGEVEQYNAGNVGGIVGSALFAEITNAENSENLVAGAHNVGGIAGYVKNGKIESSQNDGGDITASGARTDGNFATEAVMGDHEKYNIGNIGGIAGYLHGNETKISNSANRGTVHSAYFEGNTAPDEAKTANVGGVVGKVSMKSHLKNISTEEVLTSLKANSPSAIIYNSYNTGDVQGYTGVGGVAGQMVKGSIADSYNLGDVATTRRANAGTIDAVNMGGVVGDTTAVTDGSSTAIYNVYNAGTIGDGEYEFLGRHVGGVVGRLGGALEKAYNTGDIYNGYSVTGGVVGYWVSGNIKNVFNTGNVTVVNYDLNARNSLVGGIVGAATSDYDKKLSFAYNLGTLRSFIPEGYERIEVQNDTLQDGKKVLVSNSNHYTQEEIDQYQYIINKVIFPGDDDNSDNDDGYFNANEAYQLENINVVGGIIGGVTESKVGKDDKTITVDNVYSTGNIFAGRFDTENQKYEKSTDSSDRVSAIWGRGYTNGDGQNNVELTNSFFIKPKDSELFSEAKYNSSSGYTELDWDDRAVIDEETEENHYRQQNDTNKFTFYEIDKATEDNNYAYGWRFEDGTLPILYTFTPDSAKHEGDWNTDGKYDVQFGTAANPLLTIIKGSENVQLNWDKLHISGAGGLAVYDGNLTINNFSTQMGRYYNGIIFSDGNLTINANGDGRYNLGSGAHIYGENVKFTAEGDTTIYGSVTSTNGNIEISGNNVSVIGELTAKGKDETTPVGGIAPNADAADSEGVKIDENELRNPNAPITTVDMAYSHTTDKATHDGSITVTADKNAEVLYGNMGEGRIETALDFTVSGKESVYVDSDLHIGKDLNLKSDGEIVLDLSNMGDISKENLHDNFLDHFKKNDAGKSDGAINIYGVDSAVNLDNFMIALDMWDYQNNKFDLKKYDVAAGDYEGADEHDLVDDLNALNISGVTKAQEHTFIWVDGAEQLKGIQAYKDMKDGEQEETSILSYNFALKDDIDASQLENYKGIAADKDEVFTGTFDGRGFRIIGLDANKGRDEYGNETINKVDNAGIFGTIGVARDTGGKITQTGIVKDLSVYSSHFTGQATAGAIAGRNEGGNIAGITTFGNRIEVTGEKSGANIERGKGAGKEAGKDISVAAAGGIVGVNAGTITSSRASDTVIAGETTSQTDDAAEMTVAGGVAGINIEHSGSIGDAYNYMIERGAPDVTSTSAVLTNTQSNANKILHGLGGIVGINENGLTNVASFGITNGSYDSSSHPSNEYVGGIAGINYFAIYGAYNESTVTGSSNVGGIAGKNDFRLDFADEVTSYTGPAINNSVNASSVTVIGTGENAGGIVGSNYGAIDYGRNTGTVTGADSVGGIVGFNDAEGKLNTISNAVAAEITGEIKVGGIAGDNKGEITAESNLVNEGKITGVQYVGGIAGSNSGVISGGTHESGAELTNRAKISGTQYVGGIAGKNEEGGRIVNTNVESTIEAEKDESGNIPTQYFGGVTGVNAGTIENATNTVDLTVDGGSYVGGITGLNDTDGRFEGELVNTGNIEGYSNVGGIAGENKSELPAK